MEKTPKIPRKSLSLGSRLNSKRHSASPQTLMRNVQTALCTAVTASTINSAAATTPRSPSVISIASDCGIECTPPHKKFSFDDSLDYSPHTLDSSFSPSGMFSQTLAIESPEVGWKWNRGKFDKTNEVATVTPDSAYAADSSFTSAGSSSTEVFSTARTRSDTQRQRKKLDNRREEHRKALQQQQRKAEKLKMDEMLKRRCAKLQKQLKEAQSNTLLEKQAVVVTASSQLSQTNDKLISSSPVTSIFTRSATTSQQLTTSVATKAVLSVNSNDSINDFFNDSESDGMLLEATQQLESQIVEFSQNQPLSQIDVNTNSQIFNTKTESSVVVTTPKSSGKEKQRSSFYSKFLEDDSADDWFVALDDVVLQATQKPRTSFQRYKSMPIDTTTSTSKSQTTKLATTSERTFASNVHKKDATATVSAKGFKRHASSHTLSPSRTSSTDSIESHLNFCKEILMKFIENGNNTSNQNEHKDFGFRSRRRLDLLNADDIFR